MDWQIKPLAHSSAVSGEPLVVGDRVECFVFLDEAGALTRADIRENETERFPRPESVLGRWQRVVKDRGEEQREAREQTLATAEDLFFSLFEMEDGEPETVAEREALKQVLALMLERKRILRSQGRVTNGVQNYLHVRSKRTVDVPMHELEPEQILSLQDKLEGLVL